MRKTVLITGASGGLGLEFARIYAREGFDLVVVARSEGKLYKLKSELETQYDCHVWVLAQDLSQPDAAYEVFNYTLEKNITIDALVNNAGFGDFGNFWEVDAQRQTDDHGKEHGRNGDIQRLPEGQQELPLNNGECFLQYLSGKEIIQHTGSPPGR